ncbi:unnamed protein product [Allacma fusca]|uniref:DOMON domain-containing protein n=1 Tax=Allacma fusca TaxID=39272 RepID=A0A8J2NVQ0_9HEXA|nr:unnamed protein product [Allacma fusca]
MERISHYWGSASIRREKAVKLAREETIGPGYKVRWEVNNETITFDIEANTTGYVGLGFNKNGSMTNADIVMGGVDDRDNSTYFYDMHAVGFSRPIEDEHQDYKLLNLTQLNGVTRLRFSRNLITGDPQDTDIKLEDTYFIWATGLSDNIGYHGGNRGKFAVNILAHAKTTTSEQKRGKILRTFKSNKKHIIKENKTI